MDNEKQKRKNLDGPQIRAVYLYLLQKANGKKKLPDGVRTDAATKFEISARTVSKIWAKGRAVTPEQSAEVLKSFSPKKKLKCGRKSRHIPADAIKAVPVKK